jgi:toxin FitB
MKGYLLDTNVISGTRKSNRSHEVMNWLTEQAVLSLYTSELNIAELVYGSELVDDLMKRQVLKQWIAETVRSWMYNRVIKIDQDILVRWRILSSTMKKVHQYTPDADQLTAASAANYNLVIVTRDHNPFVLSGVPTLNPWTGKRFNGA